ncbi:hypothetical protein [Lentimicrobium sp. S6]|uniref:hypothetical protein n=1 Tax=Lentimicrobium sp. S6 TaxID=2735872 RepID=UPI001555C009|nr:hypothetical protein [Lentimicrobium sp. S6]NPD48079.1 hypothetical protein [Lentimicrobium sp. S6]
MSTDNNIPISEAEILSARIILRRLYIKLLEAKWYQVLRLLSIAVGIAVISIYYKINFIEDLGLFGEEDKETEDK